MIDALVAMATTSRCRRHSQICTAQHYLPCDDDVALKLYDFWLL